MRKKNYGFEIPLSTEKNQMTLESEKNVGVRLGMYKMAWTTSPNQKAETSTLCQINSEAIWKRF